MVHDGEMEKNSYKFFPKNLKKCGMHLYSVLNKHFVNWLRLQLLSGSPQFSSLATDSRLHSGLGFDWTFVALALCQSHLFTTRRIKCYQILFRESQ